jgi:hypothetical protein
VWHHICRQKRLFISRGAIAPFVNHWAPTIGCQPNGTCSILIRAGGIQATKAASIIQG